MNEDTQLKLSMEIIDKDGSIKTITIDGPTFDEMVVRFIEVYGIIKGLMLPRKESKLEGADILSASMSFDCGEMP